MLSLRWSCSIESLDLCEDKGTGAYEIAAMVFRLPPLEIPRPVVRYDAFRKVRGVVRDIAGSRLRHFAAFVLIIMIGRPSFDVLLSLALCSHVGESYRWR